MLEVKDVSVSHGATEVVAGAGVSLGPGGLTALIGPNGAGKSSLLKAVAGLVPSRGTVSVGGAPLSRPRRQGKIAYMPQDTGAVSSLTILEVVLLGRLRSLGMRGSPRRSQTGRWRCWSGSAWRRCRAAPSTR